MRSSGRITTKRRVVAAYTAIPASGGTSGAADWRRSMFAFAQALYTTIGTDFLVDFTQGSLGDYALAVPTNNAVGNILTTARGGVLELDTGGTTVAGTTVGAVGKGNPTITPNVKTGAPWFCAARGRINTLCPAGGQNLPISMTQVNPFTAGAAAFGQAGTTSLTNYTFTDGTTTTDTGVAVDTANFHDFAIGFDGTTLTFFFGDVLLGTLVSKGTSTVLTGLSVSAGQSGAFIVVAGGSTVRQVMDVDKLYAATPVP